MGVRHFALIWSNFFFRYAELARRDPPFGSPMRCFHPVATAGRMIATCVLQVEAMLRLESRTGYTNLRAFLRSIATGLGF
jgi:hypothetical protein